MGIARSIYDWLGNRLSGASVDGIFEDATRTAFTEAAFGVCSAYIGAAIASAPVKVIRHGKRAHGDWNEYLWGVSPNLNQEAGEFVTEIVHRMLRYGRSVVVPHGNMLYLADGAPIPERKFAIQDVYRALAWNGDAMGDYKATDVFVFRCHSPRVATLVGSLSDSYGAMASAAESRFRDSSAKRYKLRMSSTQSGTEEEATRYEAYVNNQLKPFIKSDRAILPEYSGMELVEFGSKSQTVSSYSASDFIDVRKDAFEAVAEAMRMPTSMLYGNVNNFSEVFRSFMTFAVAPVAHTLSSEITRKTFGYSGWKDNSRIEFDLSTVKYTDLFDAAESADKLLASSLLSPDEILHLLGQDTIGKKWSKEHYITKNYAPAGVESTEGGE